jgi:hypothetical protein
MIGNTLTRAFAGAAVTVAAALPVMGKTHYTGHVPASISMTNNVAPVKVKKVTLVHKTKTAVAHKVSKKTTAVKHPLPKKHVKSASKKHKA